MKERLLELLCVISGHRWAPHHHHSLDVIVGFQPDLIVMVGDTEGSLENYTVQYNKCSRCGLVDATTIGASLSFVAKEQGEEA